jgi:hypothetical protein
MAALSLAALLLGFVLVLMGALAELAIPSLVLTLYCACILLSEYRSKNLASPPAIYAALFLVHYSVPGAIQSIFPDTFLTPENLRYAPEALIYLTLVLLAIHAACALVRTESRAPLTPDSLPFGRYQVLVAVMALMAIGFAARIYVIQTNTYFQIARSTTGELAGPFHAIVRMLEVIPAHALVIWAIYYYQDVQHRFSDRFILGLLVFAELAYWLPSGRKEPVILAILLPLVVKYLATHSLPSRKLVLGFVGMLFLYFPLIHYYRVAIDIGGLLGRDPIDAIAQALEGIGAVQSQEIGISQVLLARLSLLEPVAACMRLVETGYWYFLAGGSYVDGLLALVPRLVWDEKPDFHYGTEFGHAAGLLDPTDPTTSISVSFPGEAYLNFGWGGVLAMMAMAAAFSFFYERTRRGPIWQLLYMVCLPIVLYIGGTFALYFGGLAKLLVIFCIIAFWLVNRRGTNSPTPLPAAI